MQYWHRVASLKEVGTYLISRGVAPAEVLRHKGLPTSLLLDADMWIEREVCFNLVAEVGRITADPYLGLHLAEVQRLPDYGPWAAGVLRAPTLRHALEFAAHHISLIRTGLAVRMRSEEGGRVVLAAVFEGVSDDAVRHPSLACMTTLYRIVRRVAEPVDVEVRLCLPSQRASDEAERLLGSKLVFGADRNELVFDQGILDLPLRPLTPSEDEVFGLLRNGQPLATARETYRTMRELLDSGRATVADVAGALDMSVRRMQRHLDKWGATFEGLLDEYRQISALTQLIDSTVSVTEIAFRLGYSDSSHFTRAMRRWTGRSPRQIRMNPDWSRAWRHGENPELAAAARESAANAAASTGRRSGR